MAGIFLYISLIFGCVFTKEVLASCNFPDNWSNNIIWMMRRDDSNLQQFEMILFNRTNTIKLVNDLPKDIYECESFEEVQNRYYYIRSLTVGNSVVKTCIMNYFINDVILQQESTSSSSVSSLAACKTAITSVDLYTVLVKVSLGENDFEVTSSYDYPFDQIPYQVSYILTDDVGGKCTNDNSSILSVNGPTISIIACDFDFPTEIPRSGTIHCNSRFTPQDLGESGDTNGDVMIIQWRTETTDKDFVYCAKYKVVDLNVIMSIDVTSSSDIQCKRNQRYDWYGTKSGRQYAQMKLKYQSHLVSRPTIRTTPISTMPASGSTVTIRTTTRAPRSTTPPAPAPTGITHVQVKINVKYDDAPSDKAAFKRDMQSAIMASENNDITQQQFQDNIAYNSSSDGKLAVTVDIRGLTTAQTNHLSNLFDSKDFVVMSGNKAYNVIEGSFLYWQDNDNCPSQPCANAGTCWKIQGSASCHCPPGYASDSNCRDTPTTPSTTTADAQEQGCPDLPCYNNGTCQITNGKRECVCSGSYKKPYCRAQASTGISKTNLNIIISVCVIVGVATIIFVIVFICLRKRKSKRDEKSLDGYSNNNGTIDDRDREMYSTINKKPKAYHERSFVEGPEDGAGDHGELTGIH